MGFGRGFLLFPPPAPHGLRDIARHDNPEKFSLDEKGGLMTTRDAPIYQLNIIHLYTNSTLPQAKNSLGFGSLKSFCTFQTPNLLGIGCLSSDGALHVLRICSELGLLFIVPRNLPKIGFLSHDATHLMCGNLLGIGPRIK